MKLDNTKIAIAAVKTVISNMTGTEDEWRALLDIAAAQLRMERNVRGRHIDYHVRHGKKKD